MCFHLALSGGYVTGMLMMTTSVATYTVALSGTTLPAGTISTKIASTGSAGAYGPTGTVTRTHGGYFPGGNISLVDTSNGDLALGSAALTARGATFTLNTYSPPPVGDRSGGVASGDFNDDGKLDMVVENYGFPGCSSIVNWGRN